MLFNIDMATSKELRLKNLRSLVAEFKTADDVAKRALTAPMYLSQILTGAQSSTGTVRGVGDALARKLEHGCDKPVGWMDRDHEKSNDGDSNSLLSDGARSTDELRLLIAWRLGDEVARRMISNGVESAMRRTDGQRRDESKGG